MMIGQRRPSWQDTFAGGMSAAPVLDVPQIEMPERAQPSRQKPNWAGIIGDVLLSLGGQAPRYAPMMERQRQEQSEFERGEQQYQRRRMDSREDKIWERDNTPKSPYRWEANDGSLMEMGPDGLVRQAYKDPTPKMQTVQGFDEQGNPVLRFIAPPQAPQIIDKLPPGVVPLGGAGSSAPRTFR